MTSTTWSKPFRSATSKHRYQRSQCMFTPLYVNPTHAGRDARLLQFGDRYHGVCGSRPDNFYFNYGFYDGNLARGEQTGFDGPRFNGYYLHLLEVGANWKVGRGEKAGQVRRGGVVSDRQIHRVRRPASRGGERHLPLRLPAALLREPRGQQQRPARTGPSSARPTPISF